MPESLLVTMPGTGRETGKQTLLETMQEIGKQIMQGTS